MRFCLGLESTHSPIPSRFAACCVYGDFLPTILSIKLVLVYETQTNWWSSSTPGNPSGRYPYPAPFNQPFYIIMNLAVGGQFGGNPDDTTVFPGEMQVKYVRVYGEAPAQPSSVALAKIPLNNLSAEAIISTGTNGVDGRFDK